MAIGQTNVSMDDILYEKAGNPSKTPPLLNRKNISLYGLSVNGVADYQDATTSVGIDLTGSPDQTAPYGMGEFRGYSQALFRSTMNADYWTITSSYNTSYNSGYWDITGQGVFDYLGNNQGYVSFNTAIGSSTATNHFISAFRTYVAANGAPLIFIFSIFNNAGQSYAGGQTDISTINAYTNSNYSSGQILNVSTSSAGFSQGGSGSSYSATWSWTIGNAADMATIFGMNSGYQSGNGTHYIEVLK